MELRCPALSPRLLAAASQVRKDRIVADVGCDHGKLSAFLLESGKTPFVYASDLRPGPLSGARELIASLGLSDRCQLMLADGLEKTPGDRVDDVVIAGIGADVTAAILERAPWVKDPEKRLVLVPASKHERLRCLLGDAGFRIDREEAVFDRGHCYTVMTVCYDGVRRQPQILERWLGILDLATPAGQRYLSLVIERMQTIVRNVPEGPNESLREAKEFLLAAKEAGLLGT